MADVIDFSKRKGKKSKEINEEVEITEEDMPKMLMCNKCGNCLFMLMLMKEGDVAPMCQHCQSEFDFDELVEFQFVRGLNVPEEDEPIGSGMEVEMFPDDEED